MFETEMKCLNCGKGKARNVPPYGYLPCTTCTRKNRNIQINPAVELTTNEIKTSRKQYAADIVQRYRGATPSLEYIKRYGTRGFTPEEIKEAKNVWSENSYYENKTERGKDYIRVKK